MTKPTLTSPEERATHLVNTEFDNIYQRHDAIEREIRAALVELVEVFRLRTDEAVRDARKFREKLGGNSLHDDIEESTVTCLIDGLKKIINEILPDEEKIGADDDR